MQRVWHSVSTVTEMVGSSTGRSGSHDVDS